MQGSISDSTSAALRIHTKVPSFEMAPLARSYRAGRR